MEQKCFAFLLRASDIHVQLVRKNDKNGKNFFFSQNYSFYEIF